MTQNHKILPTKWVKVDTPVGSKVRAFFYSFGLCALASRSRMFGNVFIWKVNEARPNAERTHLPEIN